MIIESILPFNENNLTYILSDKEIDENQRQKCLTDFFKPIFEIKTKAEKLFENKPFLEYIKKINLEIEERINNNSTSNRPEYKAKNITKIFSKLNLLLKPALIIALIILKTYLSTLLFVALSIFVFVPLILIIGSISATKTLIELTERIVDRNTTIHEWMNENREKIGTLRHWILHADTMSKDDFQAIINHAAVNEEIKLLLKTAKNFHSELIQLKKAHPEMYEIVWSSAPISILRPLSPNEKIQITKINEKTSMISLESMDDKS